jgi:hypothetical protein
MKLGSSRQTLEREIFEKYSIVKLHGKSSSGSRVVQADRQTNRQTYGKWNRRKLFAIFRTRLTSGSNYQDIARCVRHRASRNGIRSRLPTGEGTETLGNQHRGPTFTQAGVFRLQIIPWAVASTTVPHPTWILRVSLSAQTCKNCMVLSLNCTQDFWAQPIAWHSIGLELCGPQTAGWAILRTEFCSITRFQ